jgi:putative ABC transport system permease protein
LPWSTYVALRKDPRVELAIPYAVGDNYRSFRIVGTTDDIFNKYEYQEGRKFRIEAGGHAFDPNAKQAVIGSYVAQKTGLKTGSKFNPYHGVYYDETTRHEDEYTVTGVLEPTNTPSDRVIWIPLDGMYRMSGHVLRGTGNTYDPKAGQTIPDEAKEVSSVMLKFRSPQVGFALDQTVNKQGKVATLAWPIGRVMAELFDKIGWMSNIMAFVAYMVVAVAAASILASIYNTMNERRREFAILRALGAGRGTVFSAIILEAAAIAAIGSLLGMVVYAAILTTASVIIRAQTGVVLNVLEFHPILAVGPAGMTLLGAVSGVVPALKAYQTDVATNLIPHS